MNLGYKHGTTKLAAGNDPVQLLSAYPTGKSPDDEKPALLLALWLSFEGGAPRLATDGDFAPPPQPARVAAGTTPH